MISVPLELSGSISGSQRFGNVNTPQIYEKLSYDPCSLWSSVVQAGSVGLNHSELVAFHEFGFHQGLKPSL